MKSCRSTRAGLNGISSLAGGFRIVRSQPLYIFFSNQKSVTLTEDGFEQYFDRERQFFNACKTLLDQGVEVVVVRATSSGVEGGFSAEIVSLFWSSHTLLGVMVYTASKRLLHTQDAPFWSTLRGFLTGVAGL